MAPPRLPLTGVSFDSNARTHARPRPPVLAARPHRPRPLSPPPLRPWPRATSPARFPSWRAWMSWTKFSWQRWQPMARVLLLCRCTSTDRNEPRNSWRRRTAMGWRRCADQPPLPLLHPFSTLLVRAFPTSSLPFLTPERTRSNQRTHGTGFGLETMRSPVPRAPIALYREKPATPPPFSELMQARKCLAPPLCAPFYLPVSLSADITPSPPQPLHRTSSQPPSSSAPKCSAYPPPPFRASQHPSSSAPPHRLSKG